MADKDDLKALLTQLVAKMDTLATKKDVAAIEAQLQIVNTRLDGFEKRLDDQGRILAALIPTRIAAVPPAA